MLDEKGQPNVGPFSCGGLVTVDSKSGAITRSGQYWAFAHYSKAVQRGGSHVFVLGNQGSAREVSVACAGKSLRLDLPADSVLTLVWNPA